MSLASGSVTDEQPAAGDATPIVPAFDGFRGAAALAILVYHCWLPSQRPSFGIGGASSLFAGLNLGVDVFFIISGFVLFLPMARKGSLGSIRAYAIRRGARIVPAYYALIVVVIVFWDQITVPNSLLTYPLHDGDGFVGVISHLGFVQNLVLTGPLMRVFGYDGAHLIPPLAHTWSLTVEVCFYVALPLVARRFARRPFAWLAGCVVLALSWRVMCLNIDTIASWFGAHPSHDVVVGLRHQLLTALPAFAVHFALGMMLAVILVRSYAQEGWWTKLRRPRVGAAALAGAGLAVVVTWWWWGHENMRGWDRGSFVFAEDGFTMAVLIQLLFAVAVAAFAACVVLGPRFAARPWSTPIARWLGDVSYGVFLWHYVVLYFDGNNLQIRAVGPEEKFVAYLVCTLALTLVLAALSRRYIEQPAIRWAQRLSREWNRAPAEAVQPMPA
jgi:peptidoglycan/LPS O-acetylase OafA/YrhL